MKKVLRSSLVVLLVVFLASCKGQNGKDRINENLTPEETTSRDGIHPILKVDTVWTPNAPSRITRKIKKDSEGNLLFAAYEDIIRYDGVSFTRFTNEEGLDPFDAFDILEDKNGSIWIASTHFGVFKYSTWAELELTEKPISHFTTKNGLLHNRAMCIYEDRTGGIWIGTEGGISYYDGKNQPNRPSSFHNFSSNEGLTDSNVNTIMEDKTGKIWVGTRGSLSIYDPLKKGNFDLATFTEIISTEGETFENIWSIMEDQTGHIWLGGQDGLWRYDGHSFTNLTTINVQSVYEDKTGNVWFTHSSTGRNKAGLSRYDQSGLLGSNPKPTEIFIGEGMFFGITEDKEGHIWVGKLDGVFRYNGKSVNYFKEEQPMSK